MESYIVRIYQRTPAGDGTGTVEEPVSGSTAAFRTLAELSAWLRAAGAREVPAEEGRPQRKRPGTRQT